MDATGRTAEELHHTILQLLGVDLSPRMRRRWRRSLRRLRENRLVLVLNGHRAGTTRGSCEPERVLSRVAGQLSGSRVGLVVHSRLEDILHDGVVLTMGTHQQTPPETWPPAVHALALAECRVAPLSVWAELTSALTGEPVSVSDLETIVEERPELLTDELGIRFADETLAEYLRTMTDAEDFRRVNAHVAHWLQELAPSFRNPVSWKLGELEAKYAASALVMHAAQASQLKYRAKDNRDSTSPFTAILEDGHIVANIPREQLIDGAKRAFIGSFPRNTAAADAAFLWPYGVTPSTQAEWASWLHLMARARGNRALADAIADSGLILPWKAKWTNWRPPGGFHPSFSVCHPVDGLAEVRWQGHRAVAGLDSTTASTTLWDPSTGRLLAGPWQGNELPAEHCPDLDWPHNIGEGRTSPTTFNELFASLPDASPAHQRLLCCPPLTLDDVVVLGGEGGVLAIEVAEGEQFGGIDSNQPKPLSGPYATAQYTTPIDAKPPSLDMLVDLFGPDEIRSFQPEEFPAALTNEAARSTLMQFGLPSMHEGGMGIYPWGEPERLLHVFAERPWPSGISRPRVEGPYLQIGFWMGGELVIDGSTGHVLRIPTEPDEDHLEALPAACTVESFLIMVGLWVTGLRIKPSILDDDESFMLNQHVSVAQSLIDEKGAEAPAWSYLFHNE
ncbi:SUKH-4 family immunity protein [Streptomyces chattanoogensis]|uniref:SUKH-4 family immunity protein n=1 Tax=Streptomyces chattanoogensis TaxID=66876 RepID=UPI00369A6545